MSLSSDAFHSFVERHLSTLTACAPRSLAGEFPDSRTWLDGFPLDWKPNGNVLYGKVPLAYAAIRRAEAAIEEWELACQATRGDLQKLSVYFTALRHFENCVLAVWQGFGFCRRALKVTLVREPDERAVAQLTWLYNYACHFDPQRLAPGSLSPVWLTNDGVESDRHGLTFEEIRDAVTRLARIARVVTGSDGAGQWAPELPRGVSRESSSAS